MGGVRRRLVGCDRCDARLSLGPHFLKGEGSGHLGRRGRRLFRLLLVAKLRVSVLLLNALLSKMLQVVLLLVLQFEMVHKPALPLLLLHTLTLRLAAYE